MVCGELLAEAVAASLYGNDKHKAGDETLLYSIMQMQRNYICRVSHPEPGMPAKRYFQDLRKKFSAEISETVDNINNL
jgi:hypothetical protein